MRIAIQSEHRGGSASYFAESKNDIIACYPFSFRENVGFGQVDDIEDDPGIRLASRQGGAEGILERCGMDGLLSKTMEDSGFELSGGAHHNTGLSQGRFCKVSRLDHFGYCPY